ncbi:MAG: bifunctional demethylmenaquinone methyltransferase/2-methoxy-6-polyprenyl-1,4-benzoquinol methylase UbiE [FCB group bacterium]|jgi:demethylmenaquinone methyltransferase/2-methoxy-6-polyprenyl-1,4-benzoquinol methylase
MSEEIRNMFSKIAGKYDFLNSLLSFRIHYRWRKKTVKLSQPEVGCKLLDCACGTGDMAFAYSKALNNNIDIIGIDFCEEMLVIAREKAQKKDKYIKFQTADLLNMEFPDNKFDMTSIAFGIRNVDSITAGLSEMARVVKPGGKVVVLEFGQPTGFFLALFKLYSKFLIPVIGRLIARQGAAYHYLPESVSKFPCREDFIALMNETDKFSESKYFPLTLGLVYVYIGVVK